MASVEALIREVAAAWRPPKRMTLSEWSDAYAYLSAESAAHEGRWRTLPYQRGMMDAMTDPAVEQIVVIKSARVGYTKMLNNLIGYHIHQDPCPIMVVQPTIEDAEGYSKEEIAPMLRDTPARRRVAVLGWMRELGTAGEALHAGLAAPRADAGVTALALVGTEMAALQVDGAVHLPDRGCGKGLHVKARKARAPPRAPQYHKPCHDRARCE
jgi:hypothetical protein